MIDSFKKRDLPVGNVPLMSGLTVVSLTSVVHAQPGEEPTEPAPAHEHEHEQAKTSAARGGFLQWTAAPGSDSRALVNLQAGYDAARGGTVFDTAAEVQLFGPVSVRGGGEYVGPDGAVRPSFDIKVDALRQSRHGVSLAVFGGYEGHGFNMVPAATAMVAVARSVGPVNLVGNVGTGLGLQDQELYGDCRVAVLAHVLPDLFVGLDTRGRIDLERDTDEPAGEPEWELLAGPMASYSIDRFVLSAGVGVSSIKYRLTNAKDTGAMANLALGVVF